MKHICLLLLFPLCLNGQVNSEILTDSSVVLGTVLDDVYVGKDPGAYCIGGIDRYLKKGTLAIVSGVLNCRSFVGGMHYYEIIDKNETFYIEKDKFTISNENAFESISKFSTELKNSFKEHAQLYGKLFYNQQLNKVSDFFNDCKPKGLSVLKWNLFDVSEYTDGTGFKIHFYNPTSKTIKYIWTTIVGYNSVDDKVISKGQSSFTVKGVGPIEPEKEGSYSYDYVWMTDLVETAKIISIKVQYMDGSFKTVTNPKEIIMNKNLRSILFDDDEN